jgi:hypothetical protein
VGAIGPDAYVASGAASNITFLAASRLWSHSEGSGLGSSTYAGGRYSLVYGGGKSLFGLIVDIVLGGLTLAMLRRCKMIKLKTWVLRYKVMYA